MPPLLCPRCKNTNPEIASFCFFDGEALRGQITTAEAHKLPKEFPFPSGRRCRTYDELVQGCQEEWAVARDLLRKGIFEKFFAAIGRQDLVRAAKEAMSQADANIGLTNLLASLPARAGAAGPRLDLNPRRLNLGSLLAGETRKLEMTVSNQGQGTLHGTVSVVEGGAWLRVGGGDGQCELKTTREQKVSLQVDTRGLPAAQTYGGKLTVATNGGVVEVPVRMDLAAHPFPRAPFQGARAPRELAQKMLTQPKAAVPLLESGDIARWFAANGWNYPVRGTPARGIAGVQQFFENLGLSKPPIVQLSQKEMRCPCTLPNPVRAQVTLGSNSKKWVHANVESDTSWLKVLTPQVAGPQQAVIAFEIDPRLVPRGQPADGTLTVSANGGQTLTLRVRTQVMGAEKSIAGRLLQPVVTVALVLLLVRMLLMPLADFFARDAAMQAAAEKALGGPQDFNDYFTSRFVRIVTLGTFWLGAVGGAFVLWRRSGVLSAPWGLVAGAVAGLGGAATLASLVLVGDKVPELICGPPGAGGAALPVWILVVLPCWAVMGAALGAVLGLAGPLGRVLLAPMQGLVAGLCRLCGLSGAAEYFAP